MNSFDISHRVEAVCVRCVLGTCSGRCKVLLLLFKSHKSLTQKGPRGSLVQAVLAPSDTTLPKLHFPKSPPSTAVKEAIPSFGRAEGGWLAATEKCLSFGTYTKLLLLGF